MFNCNHSPTEGLMFTLYWLEEDTELKNKQEEAMDSTATLFSSQCNKFRCYARSLLGLPFKSKYKTSFMFD